MQWCRSLGFTRVFQSLVFEYNIRIWNTQFISGCPKKQILYIVLENLKFYFHQIITVLFEYDQRILFDISTYLIVIPTIVYINFLYSFAYNQLAL